MANIQFKSDNQNQSVLFPSRLDENIPAIHPVRIVNEIVDKLDIRDLLSEYKGGDTSAYHPRMLLKILIYGYLNNLYSSRRIAQQLTENIHFMWLSGRQTPDFRTINDFRSKRLKGRINALFTSVVQLMAEEGFVSLTTQYIDGTKLESASNRYTFVWRRQNMFGCLPLRFYNITKDKRYLDLGLPYADTQWELPANANEEERKWDKKGYSWQTRLWIDDMYMITIVQSEAYKATGDPKYINRAAKEMVLYLDELQHPNGLFYHAPDVPYYWGRGDGWMAVGMTELLYNLPEKDPNRARIMKGYLLMMDNLKKYVNKDGLWNQLITEPDFWTETSGSAMFAYAMIVGVNNGWLNKEEYAPVARRAWLGLCNYINDKNDLTEVCVGTGKKNSKQYYMDRPRIAGDYHGQAPIIWCAYALLNK